MDFKEDIKINDIDLNYRQYKEAVLIKNIDNLFRKTLLNTQILSEEFCAEHIYSMLIKGISESEEFDMDDIMKKQPHLNKTKLSEAIQRHWFSKQQGFVLQN